MNYAICIPTLNAEKDLSYIADLLKSQSFPAKRILVLDSDSNDSTEDVCRMHNFEFIRIKRVDFDHGGTRNQCVNMVKDCEYVVFLTQDAIPESEVSCENLLKPFTDPKVAAVYGRQLPKKGADPIERHARLFNYPDKSFVKNESSIKTLGIKTTFFSNSFSAYRITSHHQLGGFPHRTIFAEDAYFCAKAILSGWDIVYASEARVFHSHNYSSLIEFRRHFDHGVFRANEKWIDEKFGGAEKEGIRFLLSELKYLANESPASIPISWTRTFAKYAGFKLGAYHYLFPKTFCKNLSLNTNYWNSHSK